MTKRKPNGQFAEGNGGGPGRPPKKREERFMEITLSAVTYADWKAIVKKAVDQAKRGNPQARKFLADYLIGPAGQKVDITSGGERIDTGPDIGALAEVLAALGIEPPDSRTGTGG